MTAKPVALLPQAERDIDQGIEYYQSEGGPTLALQWVEAVDSALRHLGANPKTGSTRYTALLKLAGLRFWTMKQFPYLIFSVEREAQIDVWRVVHAQRDVPEWLRELTF